MVVVTVAISASLECVPASLKDCSLKTVSERGFELYLGKNKDVSLNSDPTAKN